MRVTAERQKEKEGSKEGRAGRRFLSTTEGEFISSAKCEMAFRNKKRSGGGNSERDETDENGTDGGMPRGTR